MIFLLVAITVLINYTSVQNYLARKASGILSERLKTKVQVAHVRIDFLNHLLLQGVYIADQSADTLLYAGEVQVRITDWFIFAHKPVIHYVGLRDTYVHLYRRATSNKWNYEFIADALSPGGDTSHAGKPLEFDLKKLDLRNIRFHMDDHWGGQDIDIDAGSLLVDADHFEIDKKLIGIDAISVAKTDVSLRMYRPGHPPRPMAAKPEEGMDRSPFNPGKWLVKSKALSLDGCSFHLTSDTLVPVVDQFDQDHLAITGIKLEASDLGITGDTATGTIQSLFAHERCGLEIRKMHSKVSVSPVASICSGLYLETNHSKVKDYYAMHYRHFPDFLEYIDSVVMVAHLKDASIDIKDIAYFAPQLRNFPDMLLKASGNGKGTVANLEAQNLVVSDGNSVLTGSIAMKGLPDIYKTYISWTDGKLTTNEAGIVRYAPELLKNENIAIDQVKYAVFSGSYHGYIEHFGISGSVQSNLGSLGADIKMSIPGFKSATAEFSGTLSTDKLQVGTLFKQPLLGGLSLNEQISGTSFEPGMGLLNLDGTISEMTLNSYAYHNISTNGKLAKKQFSGKIMVDDPNLALEFDGDVDFSNKDVTIKAAAHLLGSNFKALHLTTDSLTASADFDLNCTGSKVDNFSGYALLNNISIKRNTRRVALDSVLVKATGDSLHKVLTIQSNAVLASISGAFTLSKLSASVQYYLSRYLPNYIKAPEKYAPEQNFAFKVATYNVDSILAVAYPLIRGFDSATISGSLNTQAKKLLLDVSVPYGSIGFFHMTNIDLTGVGNLESIGLTTNIDNVSVGDSLLNGSLSVTTTVGNDSVGFTIATNTPDSTTTITLNGLILARKDSLFLSMLPSQFYLNQTKWDIPGGKIAYSTNYLAMDGIYLSSGLQKITARTQPGFNGTSISVSTENLDLGQLGPWAGLAIYQPDGRVNGTVTVDRLFSNFVVSTNLRATDVLLGTDTIGTINVIGSYNSGTKLLSFDPQSGIYRGSSSIAVSGNISFDSASNQKLDGKIAFSGASPALATPFLTGIMSHLTGSVDGVVNFTGTSTDPVMDGDVTLHNGGFKLDYMGCSYSIPSATVHIDNRVISFGKVTAYDAYKNTAYLTGRFTHNLFRKMRMSLKVTTPKFEVLNLSSNENNLFYGTVIAKMDSFTMTGPFDNLLLNVYNATPAAKSKLFIPEVSTAGDIGAYSFASFKVYGKSPDKAVRVSKGKIAINIEANINPLLETHIILDPSSGDEIMARGEGHLGLYIPPNNDISLNGRYTIENGQYSYTFKSLRFQRIFRLNPGGYITFNGPFSQTGVSVDAVYATKARLFDLLSDADKNLLSPNDKTDALTPQMVDIIMHMNGLLSSQKLTFDLDLEDKHTQGTVAYQMLRVVNNDDRQKINQVASLLIIGDFTSPEGISGSTALTGAINNLSQIVSGSASTALTSAINKITGDRKINATVLYNNYNYTDPATAAVNRSELKLGINKTYLNNRLQVELGGTSDWGHPASQSSTTNFDLTGDFRIQYQLTEQSNLRANVFRTSDYDVTLDRDIIRSGVGITWRKSFDGLGDFFRGNKHGQKDGTSELKSADSVLHTADTTVK